MNTFLSSVSEVKHLQEEMFVSVLKKTETKRLCCLMQPCLIKLMFIYNIYIHIYTLVHFDKY